MTRESTSRPCLEKQNKEEADQKQQEQFDSFHTWVFFASKGGAKLNV